MGAKLYNDFLINFRGENYTSIFNNHLNELTYFLMYKKKHQFMAITALNFLTITI